MQPAPVGDNPGHKPMQGAARGAEVSYQRGRRKSGRQPRWRTPRRLRRRRSAGALRTDRGSGWSRVTGASRAGGAGCAAPPMRGCSRRWPRWPCCAPGRACLRARCCLPHPRPRCRARECPASCSAWTPACPLHAPLAAGLLALKWCWLKAGAGSRLACIAALDCHQGGRDAPVGVAQQPSSRRTAYVCHSIVSFMICPATIQGGLQARGRLSPGGPHRDVTT